MKIYITGSSGLVGKNLQENSFFSKQNLLTPASKDLNLLIYDDVLKFIKANKPDIIIHTAGKVGGIQANIHAPYDFFLENIQMGINLVRAAKETGIKIFLNLSSSCSYPCCIENPLREDMVFAGSMEPTNEGYAIAKASILRMCEYVNKQFSDYSYKTIIPCNLYGRWDKFGEHNSHMIPAVIKKLHHAVLNNISSVEIWGSGNARREFMYAGDLADLIAHSVQNFDSMPDKMNAGLGFDYSVNEYYNTIAKIVGYKGAFTHDLTKPEGMKQKLLEVSRQTEFGFKPKTSLEEGIKLTYEFYLEHYGEKNNEI